jgi:hypothetical protein
MAAALADRQPPQQPPSPPPPPPERKDQAQPQQQGPPDYVLRVQEDRREQLLKTLRELGIDVTPDRLPRNTDDLVKLLGEWVKKKYGDVAEGVELKDGKLVVKLKPGIDRDLKRLEELADRLRQALGEGKTLLQLPDGRVVVADREALDRLDRLYREYIDRLDAAAAGGRLKVIVVLPDGSRVEARSYREALKIAGERGGRVEIVPQLPQDVSETLSALNREAGDASRKLAQLASDIDAAQSRLEQRLRELASRGRVRFSVTLSDGTAVETGSLDEALKLARERGARLDIIASDDSTLKEVSELLDRAREARERYETERQRLLERLDRLHKELVERLMDAERGGYKLQYVVYGRDGQVIATVDSIVDAERLARERGGTWAVAAGVPDDIRRLADEVERLRGQALSGPDVTGEYSEYLRLLQGLAPAQQRLQELRGALGSAADAYRAYARTLPDLEVPVVTAEWSGGQARAVALGTAGVRLAEGARGEVLDFIQRAGSGARAVLVPGTRRLYVFDERTGEGLVIDADAGSIIARLGRGTAHSLLAHELARELLNYNMPEGEREKLLRALERAEKARSKEELLKSLPPGVRDALAAWISAGQFSVGAAALDVLTAIGLGRGVEQAGEEFATSLEAAQRVSPAGYYAGIGIGAAGIAAGAVHHLMARGAQALRVPVRAVGIVARAAPETAPELAGLARAAGVTVRGLGAAAETGLAVLREVKVGEVPVALAALAVETRPGWGLPAARLLAAGARAELPKIAAGAAAFAGLEAAKMALEGQPQVPQVTPAVAAQTAQQTTQATQQAAQVTQATQAAQPPRPDLVKTWEEIGRAGGSRALPHDPSRVPQGEARGSATDNARRAEELARRYEGRRLVVRVYGVPSVDGSLRDVEYAAYVEGGRVAARGLAIGTLDAAKAVEVVDAETGEVLYRGPGRRLVSDMQRFRDYAQGFFLLLDWSRLEGAAVTTTATAVTAPAATAAATAQAQAAPQGQPWLVQALERIGIGALKGALAGLGVTRGALPGALAAGGAAGLAAGLREGFGAGIHAAEAVFLGALLFPGDVTRTFGLSRLEFRPGPAPPDMQPALALSHVLAARALREAPELAPRFAELWAQSRAGRDPLNVAAELAVYSRVAPEAAREMLARLRDIDPALHAEVSAVLPRLERHVGSAAERALGEVAGRFAYGDVDWRDVGALLEGARRARARAAEEPALARLVEEQVRLVRSWLPDRLKPRFDALLRERAPELYYAVKYKEPGYVLAEGAAGALAALERPARVEVTGPERRGTERPPGAEREVRAREGALVALERPAEAQPGAEALLDAELALRLSREPVVSESYLVERLGLPRERARKVLEWARELARGRVPGELRELAARELERLARERGHEMGARELWELERLAERMRVALVLPPRELERALELLGREVGATPRARPEEVPEVGTRKLEEEREREKVRPVPEEVQVPGRRVPEAERLRWAPPGLREVQPPEPQVQVPQAPQLQVPGAPPQVQTMPPPELQTTPPPELTVQEPPPQLTTQVPPQAAQVPPGQPQEVPPPERPRPGAPLPAGWWLMLPPWEVARSAPAQLRRTREQVLAW